MLEDAHLMDLVVEDAHAMGLAGEKKLVQQVYLTGVSRLLQYPLACIVKGLSAVGKDVVKNTVASFFPPEAIYDADQLTPQALFFMPPGSLAHRFVVLGERSRSQNPEATRALREMVSKGKLSKALPIRINGQLETKRVEQDGPIAFMESTSQINVFHEDANRCLSLAADESPQQTQRVIMTIANLAASGVVTDVEGIVRRHHALQRLLRSYNVVVPYAERLGSQFPHDRVEARRAIRQVLSMIQASALLHQKQREMDEHGQLLANADDYTLARRLLAEPLARQLQGKLSAGALDFLQRLIDWVRIQHMNFTVTQAIQRETYSPASVYAWMGELRNNGFLEVIGVTGGSRSAHYQVAAAAVNYAPTMPPVQEVCGVSPRNFGDDD